MCRVDGGPGPPTVWWSIVNIPDLSNVDPRILLLLVPLLVLQFGLLVVAVLDLLRMDRHVRGGNKGVWALVIVLVNMIGPIVYFLVGRVDAPVAEEASGPGAMPGCPTPRIRQGDVVGGGSEERVTQDQTRNLKSTVVFGFRAPLRLRPAPFCFVFLPPFSLCAKPPFT